MASRHWMVRCLAVITIIYGVGIPFALYPTGALDAFLGGHFAVMMGSITAFAVSTNAKGARTIGKAFALGSLAAAGMALMARRDGFGRLGGYPVYDPNDLALLCSLTIPLVAWWEFMAKGMFGRLMLPGLPLLAYIIVQTDSRAGFLGMVAAMAGTVYTLYKSKGRGHRLIA